MRSVSVCACAGSRTTVGSVPSSPTSIRAESGSGAPTVSAYDQVTITSSESPTPVTSERTSSTGATGVGATVRMRPNRSQNPTTKMAISSIALSNLSSGRCLGITIS